MKRPPLVVLLIGALVGLKMLWWGVVVLAVLLSAH